MLFLIIAPFRVLPIIIRKTEQHLDLSGALPAQINQLSGAVSVVQKRKKHSVNFSISELDPRFIRGDAWRLRMPKVAETRGETCMHSLKKHKTMDGAHSIQF